MAVTKSCISDLFFVSQDLVAAPPEEEAAAEAGGAQYQLTAAEQAQINALNNIILIYY